jgi:Flp pilus assembly protein TadD
MEVTLLTQLFLILALQLCPGGDSLVPADDPLAISHEMREFLVDRIKVRSPDSMSLLNTLVSLVFDESAVNFTYVPETKTSIETFTEGRGNCLSFTTMFVCMARYLGLEVRFREVEIAPTWSKRGPLVTFNRHVNVAVLLRGSSYVVDLFPRVDRIEIGGRIVSDERGIAHYFNNKGADFLANGDYLRARAYFCKALKCDPEAAFVWANLGVSQGLLGDWLEAEKSYLKAIELEKDQMIAMSNLAKLYERQGREKDAAQYLGRVENFQRKNPYYHFSLGKQAYESRQFEKAIEHYKTALKRNSKEHNFHFALSKAYAQVGDVSAAIDHLKEAHKYAPYGPGKNRYSQKLEILAAHIDDGKIRSDALCTVD